MAVVRTETATISLRATLLAVLAAVVLVSGCDADRKSGKSFEDAAREVRELSLPPESNSETSDFERTGSAAHESWDFDISSSWESYRRGLAGRLKARGGFQITKESGLSLTASRRLQGDVHLVKAEEIRPGRVRVTFTSYAW